MGRLNIPRQQVTAAAAALALAFGGGCVGTDAPKTVAKKPDVTQPGVLPSPQEMMGPAPATASLNGGVVQAGGTQPAGPVAGPVAPVAVAPAPSALTKMMTRPEKKVPATDMAVAWRPQIAYLPDQTRNGAMGAGIAGQLFLFGGQKLEFALADGPLTVDLIDETPRPAGQPAATPERWQFDKETLRKLRTVDETFGKSYVLFLPWPAYKPDITKVKISARYDPENGHTLFQKPTVLSIDPSGPLGSTKVWDGVTTTVPAGSMGSTPGRMQPFGGMPPSGAMPPAGGMSPGNFPGPIPLGGGPVSSGPTMTPAVGPGVGGSMSLMPPAPANSMPLGQMPLGPPTNEPLMPFAFTAGPGQK